MSSPATGEGQGGVTVASEPDLSSAAATSFLLGANASYWSAAGTKPAATTTTTIAARR